MNVLIIASKYKTLDMLTLFDQNILLLHNIS